MAHLHNWNAHRKYEILINILYPDCVGLQSQLNVLFVYIFLGIGGDH